MYAPMAIGGLLGLGAGATTPDYTGAANTYSDSMNQIAQGFQPYVNQGFMAKKGLGALGAMNMANPAGLENRLASSYQASPYQNQIMSNTANQMDANSAQTGMLGSTAQQAALQNQMAGLNNQFQQQYIDRGTQQYNQAYGGIQNLGMMMAKQGYDASGTQGQLQQQGALAQLQAANMPTEGQNMFTGALGGAMGMMGAASLGSMMGVDF